MPTYEFKCPEHPEPQEHYLSFDDISDESKHPKCAQCGAKMIRVYCAPGLSGCPTTTG